MEMISVIMLAVVLLAQTVLFALFFREKRRSDRKNTATLAYIDKEIARKVLDCSTSLNVELEALGKSIGDRVEKLEKEQAGALNEINDKIRDLALDYTEAQEAAGKVNSYASSLAHIFDYDPVAAAKRNREKGMG